MPNIAAGASATFSMGANQSLSIQAPGGAVASISVDGTVREVVSGARIVGPYAGSVTVAAQGGSIFYEVQAGRVNIGAAGPLLRVGGNVGTRIFGGRMGSFTTSASGTTFHTAFAVAQHFDAVRVILANGSSAGTLDLSACRVSVLSDFSTDSARNNSGGSWTTVTFGGATATSIPAAPGSDSRRGYLVSDWIALSSAARIDGGTFPIVAVRAFHNVVSTAITVMGNGGTDNFTPWKTKPDGRVWVSRKYDGNAVTTPSNLTSTTDISQSSIVGVQYAARGRVVTVFANGDSITEGRGTYVNEGFVMPACNALSDINGVAFEYSNIGWSGSNSPTIRDRTLDVLNAGLAPDIMVLPCGSPNDQTTITTSTIASQRQCLARQLVELRAHNVVPLIWTWLPSNTSVKNYGATDSLRRDYNADVLSWRNRDLLVADTSAAISGATDGAGQVQMTSGSTSDNIHPNDAGNALLAPAIVEQLQNIAL